METITNRQVAVASFPDRAHAEQAIRELKSVGFGNNDIGIALRDRDEQNAVMHETGIDSPHRTEKGLIGGGVLGGLTGLLIGLGALVIPGVGPIVAGGLFVEALGATALGASIGAIGGGFIGALVDLGIPEDEAHYYEAGFKQGDAVVSVRTGTRYVEALGILNNCGGDLNTQKSFLV